MGRVDEDVCQKVVSQVLKGSFNVVNWRIEYFDEILGFQGEHGKLIVVCDSGGGKKQLNFFYKGSYEWQELHDKYLSTVRVYQKEHLMNVVVLKSLQSQVDAKLSPECYLSVVDRFFVMEDLSEEGFQTLKTGSMDLAHAELVLDKLAALHSASLITEQKTNKPIMELFPEVCFETVFNWEHRSDGLTHKAMVSLLRFIINEKYTRIEETDREPFLNWIKSTVPTMVRPSNRYKNCVLHGDPWGGNIMYRYKNGEPAEAVLIDYQLSRISTPAVDILLFLVLHMNRDERKSLTPLLVDRYYTSLSDFLISANLSPDKVFPRNEFQSSLKTYETLASCLKTYYTLYIKLPPNLLKKATQTKESYLDLMTVGNREIVGEAYDNSTEFKNAIIETLNESYQFYLENKAQA